MILVVSKLRGFCGLRFWEVVPVQDRLIFPRFWLDFVGLGCTFSNKFTCIFLRMFVRLPCTFSNKFTGT